MRTKVEIDALTGQITERPYTEEEEAQADLDEANAIPLITEAPATEEPE